MTAAFQPDAFQNDSFQTGTTVEVPAGVITFTGPPPDIPSLTIEVPAGVLTFSGPEVGLGTGIPAGLLTFSGPVPTQSQTVVIPAGVMTFSGPAVAPTIPINIPAGSITFSGRMTGVSDGIIGSGGVPYTLAGTVLFRGQVTDVNVERIDTLLKIRIEATDYNRLWPLYKVGVPHPDNFIIVPYIGADGATYGTKIYIDSGALNYSDGPGDGGVFRYVTRHFLLMKDFLPRPMFGFLDLTTHTHNTNPDYSGVPVLHWLSMDVKSVLDDHVARQGPFTAYWIRSATMQAMYTALAPFGEESEFLEAAPWEIDNDGPIQSGNTIKPLSLSVGYDASRPRERVAIRGGTPPASIWVDSDPPVTVMAGEEFIDAPGAQAPEESTLIGEWHLANNYKRLVRGTAVVAPRYGGWFVGQTGYFTDTWLSKVTGILLDRTPAIIRQVKSKVVAPGGIKVTINGLNGAAEYDVSALLTERSSMDWEEVGFGQPGKATITIEVFVGDAMIGNFDDRIDIPDLAELIISTDGEAEIETTLEFGDPQPGSLAIQADRGEQYVAPPEPKPVYHFVCHNTDPDIPVGGSAVLIFQLCDAAGNGIQLAEVSAELDILQWADQNATVPATEYTLDDPVGITNVVGQIYTILRRLDVAAEEQAVIYEPVGLALPVP